MGNRYILTDFDDTILDFSRPFQAWAKDQGYSFSSCLREQPSGGIPALLGIDRDEADRIVTEFTLHSREFGALPPEPCAAEVLPELHKAGYRFVGITATLDHAGNWERRWKNFKDAFGFELDRLHCTGLGTSKEYYLKRYDTGVWVEDNFGHAVVGAEVGHKTYILDRSYNTTEQHPKVTRVNDWHAIANNLL
jgi:hypothetical protein